MKTKASIGVILMLTGLLTLRSPSQNTPALPEAYNVSEAYNVYSAVLPHLWPWKEAHAKMLVFRTETEPYGMCVKPDEESNRVIGSAVADYVRVNKRTWLLQRDFAIQRPYELISGDEWNAIFQEGGWKGFYERYPDSGGLIELSAVGFNAEKTVAIVYMGYQCHYLCGGGRFHIVQKKDGKWQPSALKGGSTCEWFS